MAAERLELTLLGGFRVDAREGIVDVPVSAQRLVAFLALQERPVPRRQVAGTLWPDIDDERSGAALRSTLWRSRRCGELVTASRDALRIGPTVDVDALRLARFAGALVDEAAAAGVPTGIRFDRELLPGWYEDWVVEERERLRQLVLRALASLVPSLIAVGRADEAVGLGQQAVRLEPLSETSHQSLIAAYLAAGDRARALRQFDEHATLLRSELGLAPSEATWGLVSHLRPAMTTL
jgi:DNA-binding SARP family transcriptional activator